jgi:hypothetical protein
MLRTPDFRTAGSLAAEFRLIGQAIADAFYGLASSARFDGRFNRLSCCGGAS